ncbi:MAG: ABC transporter ATP-binding protein [Ferrovibrio sp.]|nr:MAG: ABC transporter ATP-binding protein [Ferrovibrio sp.]
MPGLMTGQFSELRESLAYLATHYPVAMVTSLVLLFAAAMAESIGVFTLLPVLQVVSGATAGEGAANMLLEPIRALGLEPTLPLLLVVMVAGILLKAVLTLSAAVASGFAAAQIATDLRIALMRTLMKAQWSYFIRQPVGILANAVSGEAMRASGIFVAACRLISELVRTAVYVVLALFVSWPVTIAAVAAGLVMLIIMRGPIRVARDASVRQNQALRSLTQRLADGLMSFKAIKAMGREDRLAPLLEADTQEVNRSQRKEMVAIALMANANEPLIAVILAFGVYGAVNHADTPFSQLLFMAVVLQRILAAIGATQNSYQGLVRMLPAWLAQQQSITAASRAPEINTGRKSPDFRRQIVLDHVTFAYGEAAVLHDLSLSVPAGQLTTIVGPSGSGKTTIIDLILGLQVPQSGTVRLDGVDLTDIDLQAWRRSIGYVPQEVYLFNDSIYANVSLDDPMITPEAAENALRAADAWAFVEKLSHGMETPIGERGGWLSGGQRQRIAIARALARRPALLILDEATSALDSRTEAEICATLAALKGKVTILAISHQPALAALADTVYHLKDGVVIEASDGIGLARGHV